MTWIKMRTNLWDDGRIIRLAQSLGVSRPTVIGACHRLWSLADEHTVNGFLYGYLADQIDQACDLPGFANALSTVGWLSLDDPAGSQVVNFDEHNGESAKKRALTAKRNAGLRQRKRDSASVTQSASRRDAKCVTGKVTQSASPDQIRSDQIRSESETSYRSLSDLISEADHIFSDFGLEERDRVSVMVDRGHQKLQIAFDPKKTGVIGRAATLVVAGRLPEAWFWDSIEAARQPRIKNRPGYFRRCLAERFEPKRTPDAAALARSERGLITESSNGAKRVSGALRDPQSKSGELRP